MSSRIVSGGGKAPAKIHGFSLIEVMICLAILMIGAAGLTTLHVEMIRAEQTSSQYAKAMTLAQSKLEELRHFKSIHHRSGSSFAYEDIRQDLGGHLPAGLHDQGALQLSWQVQDGPAATEWPQLPAYKQVEVAVTWKDGKDLSRRLTLQGIITPYAQATVHELWFE